MEDIGTYELIGAFDGQLTDACIIRTFGATRQGIEVVIEVRDYASHPAGRFHVTVRRADDGRETRAKPANTLREACRVIPWREIS